MSGTQALQLMPAKLQHMAARAFRDVTLYELREGWSVYMADGRAEKALCVVAMVPPDRDGWLAARTRHAQVQIKALASGSVVDSTYPPDMEQVVLPPQSDVDGDWISQAWRGFAAARRAEAEAVRTVDEQLAELSGVATEADEEDPAVGDVDEAA
jgi:hypothetical protein